MLSTSGKRFTFSRTFPGISYVCKRHLTLEEFAQKCKLITTKRQNVNKSSTEDEKPKFRDPLEFRNVGEFKKFLFWERGDAKRDLNLFNKNSILRGVRADTVMGTMKNIAVKSKVKDQSYNPARVEALGPDLAAAHFIVCRGGAVKFVGEDKFIRSGLNKSNEVLPNYKDPNYKVEAIDFSKGDFVYEAISNLTDLKYLSWVSFKNCKYVDNWFLDYLSAVAPTVEYIDLTGCQKIDHYGLSCLYRFKRLKCVNVENVSQTTVFNLACLTMEAEISDFLFIGLKLKPSPKSAFNA